MSNPKIEKIVNLKTFKPDEYLIWKAQTEATFRVHGLLQLVKGEEQHPHPNADDTSMQTDDTDNDSELSEQIKRQILMFEKRQGLAYQALINCLDAPEAIKVYNLDTASAIWKRLEEEYGQTSEL